MEAREQDIKEVSLDPEDPDIKVLVGSEIQENIKKDLLAFLKRRRSTLAWKHEDITGISKDIITHKLGIDKSFRPIHQKRRKFAPERNLIIQKEVEKLLKTGMIREVKYPKWLANVVVVPKKNGKWRVCVDFTDLNKACPKDPFPLPHIDSMVDATAGHEMLTFMDASSGFQQIQMEPSDQEDTAFMTPHMYILLHCNALWFEKCRCNLSEASKYDVQRPIGRYYGSIHRRYGFQIQES